MNMTFGSMHEQLNYEVNSLKRICREAEFATYLDSVVSRAYAAPNLSADLRTELIRNYMVYAERAGARGEVLAPTFIEQIYPGMGAPVIAPQNAATQNVAPQMQQVPVQPQNVTSQMQQAPVQPQNAAPQNVAPQMQQVPVQPQNMAPQNVAPQMQQVPVQPQNMAPQYTVPQPVKKPEKKPGAEYAVGGIVLSVLGTVLILTGFIMLAVNFFDSFLQGMSLYLVCAVLITVSELVIRRFIKKLSYVFSSLGIAGFFVVTLVNYFALHLYNFWVAMALLAVFSVLTAVFAHFKKSFLFALIGYISIFTGFSLLGSIESNAQLYTLCGIMMAETVLWTLFPIKENGKAFSVILLVGNIAILFGTVAWDVYTVNNYIAKEELGLARSIFTEINFVVLLFTAFLIAARYIKQFTDERGVLHRPQLAVVLPPFIVSSVLHLFINLLNMESIDYNLSRNLSVTFGTLAVIVVAGALAFFLKRKGNVLWEAISISAAFVCFGWIADLTDNTIKAVGLFVPMLAVSLLARFTKRLSFKISDIVMKVIFAAMSMYISSMCSKELKGGLFISIVALVIITGALIFSVCQISTYKLYLILISGILMLAVFAFHNVKWLKDKHILVFDIFALTATVVVLLFINHPFYSHDMITILLVFCFGLGILVQYLQKSYGMFFAGNMMPVALYLSYFVFMLRISEGYVTSAILMGVALVCVALGFLMKQRAVRIYGLVLAMFVCIKLVFFDFAGAASLLKTIMYFIVGIIALTIAGVYIVMEMILQKKSQERDN